MDLTPSQTIGPYFALGLPWGGGPFAVSPETPGAITITGTVYDGAGVAVPDFLLETWQADSEGRFADLYEYAGPSQSPGFRGFTRYGVEDGDGTFEIVTVKPGAVAGPAGTVQAPHIAVSVFARGMMHRCATRIYFADEPDANAADAILGCVPAERRTTLLSHPVDGGYRLDIHLQGPFETVFFSP